MNTEEQNKQLNEQLASLKKRHRCTVAFLAISLVLLTASAACLAITCKSYYDYKHGTSGSSSADTAETSDTEADGTAVFELTDCDVTVTNLDGTETIGESDSLTYPGNYLYSVSLNIKNTGTDIGEKPLKIELAKLRPMNTEDYYVGTSFSMFLEVSSPNPYSLDYVSLEPNETKSFEYVIPALTQCAYSKVGVNVIIDGSVAAGRFNACVEEE